MPTIRDPIRRASQTHHLHDGAGVRRVNHSPAPDVDADVPEPGEDEHVAGPHARTCDAPARVNQRVGTVRECEAEPAVRPVDEPRAVKAARRRGASPAIRHSDFLTAIAAARSPRVRVSRLWPSRQGACCAAAEAASCRPATVQQDNVAAKAHVSRRLRREVGTGEGEQRAAKREGQPWACS